MDSGSISIILSLAGLLMMSAYFSATETAYSSLRKVRLKNLAADGNRRAELALQIASDFDRLLSTILIGNNIVNITAASLSTVLFVKYFGNAGVTISTVVMTLLVLIFGEISPKSLAKETPEKFAMLVAPITRFFMVILAPFNLFFANWKILLAKIFKVDGDRGITEEELLTIVDEAQQDGGINEQEGELIRSVIEFDDLEAIDIFTPRVDVVAVEENTPQEEIAEIFRETNFSRLPVYQNSIDNVIGVIHQKDFYNHVIYAGEPLESIIKPAVFITKSMKISRALELLQQSKSHIAIITDEYGGTAGIVTMEDILEELVGDIWDEHDEVIEEFEQLSDVEYKVKTSASLQELFDILEIDEDVGMLKVGSWVIEQLGKIPNEGESFIYKNLTVTVAHTDSQRVLEVIVKVNPEEVQEEASKVS